MSEINVQTVDQNALVDLFPDLGKTTTIGETKVRFGGSEDTLDIFQQHQQQQQDAKTAQTGAAAPPAGDGAAAQQDDGAQQGAQQQQAADTGTAQQAGTKQDVDILGTGTQQQQQGTVTPISDLSTYYQDRIKNGKFVAIEDVDKDGKPISFVPKTAEEYDEVLELQINFRLDQAKKDLEKTWYASKSPAWKAISQYAELVDDPTQLIPFLQGVKTMTSVANLDENTPDGAEQIVRSRLSQRGDTEEIIAQQIDALKTTDKLIPTAKLYKPVILQQEQVQLQTEMRQRQDQERQYQHLVSEIRDNALKSIESPVFGKTKLKNDEKAAIYDLIAEPEEATQGYGIYTVIDNLFEKRDFEKLKEVALLLSNRDAFMNYLGITVANATAAGLERKLRLAGESRSASGNDFHEEQQQNRVQRNQFKTKPSFGRG